MNSKEQITAFNAPATQSSFFSHLKTEIQTNPAQEENTSPSFLAGGPLWVSRAGVPHTPTTVVSLPQGSTGRISFPILGVTINQKRGRGSLLQPGVPRQRHFRSGSLQLQRESTQRASQVVPAHRAGGSPALGEELVSGIGFRMSQGLPGDFQLLPE